MKEDESRIAQNESNNPLNLTCPYCHTSLQIADRTKFHPLPRYPNVLRLYIKCGACEKRVIVLDNRDTHKVETYTNDNFRILTRNLGIYKETHERRIRRENN